jgi:hypothetical protein
MDAQDMLYEDDKRLVGKVLLARERVRDYQDRQTRAETMRSDFERCGYAVCMGDLHIFAMVRQVRPFIHDLAIKRHFHPFVMTIGDRSSRRFEEYRLLEGVSPKCSLTSPWKQLLSLIYDSFP